MKHSRVKMLTVTVGCTIFTAAGLLFLAERSAAAYQSMTLEKEVKAIVSGVKNAVEAYNASNFEIIHIAQTMPTIKNSATPLKEKCEQFFWVTETSPDLVGFNITDLQGNSWLREGPLYNFSERAYFKNALQGKETVYGPILNKVSNVATIFYGAPLYDNEGNLINTFFLAAHGRKLSAICSQFCSDKNMHAAIVRRTTGLVIADIDVKQVLQANIFDDSADSGDKNLIAMTAQVAAGQSGIEYIELGKEKTLHGYAPIAGTDWSVVAKVDYEAVPALGRGRFRMLLFSGAMLLLSALLSLLLAKFSC